MIVYLRHEIILYNGKVEENKMREIEIFVTLDSLAFYMKEVAERQKK